MVAFSLIKARRIWSRLPKSGVAAENCNSETASSDQVMKRQCGEWQASLKPALGFNHLAVNQHQPNTSTLTYLRGVLSSEALCPLGLTTAVEQYVYIAAPSLTHCSTGMPLWYFCVAMEMRLRKHGQLGRPGSQLLAKIYYKRIIGNCEYYTD